MFRTSQAVQCNAWCQPHATACAGRLTCTSHELSTDSELTYRQRLRMGRDHGPGRGGEGGYYVDQDH